MSAQINAMPFATNDVVFHEKFGRGTVIAAPVLMTGGDGQDSWRVEVDFESKEQRSVTSSFLKLEHQVHNVDRIRNAAKAYGHLSVAMDRRLKNVGRDVQRALQQHLHRRKCLVRGVPPVGEWKPDTDYKDAAFSSYNNPILTLNPLNMGFAIKVENIDDHGACWLRQQLTMEQTGETIRLHIGDAQLSTLPQNYSIAQLENVAELIVEMTVAIFADSTKTVTDGSDDRLSPLGFLGPSDYKREVG